MEESFLRQLFLQRLPNTAQVVLASTSDALSLEQLADLADKVLEVAQPQVVTSIASACAPSPVEEHLHVFDERLARMESAIYSLQINSDTRQSQSDSTFHQQYQAPCNSGNRGRGQFQGRGHFRGRGRGENFFTNNRNRSPSPYRYRSLVHESPECWYHWRFGNKATRCEAPCKFSPKANNNQGNE